MTNADSPGLHGLVVVSRNGNVASNDLLWLLTKGGNSFTHKRNGAYKIFTAEKGNLLNVHAHKFSGLANARAFHIDASPSGKGVTVTYRDASASPFAVKDAYKSKKVKGNAGRKTAGAVSKLVSDEKNGRLDLRKVAVARASAIVASQKARKEQRTRALRGNNKPTPAAVQE